MLAILIRWFGAIALMMFLLTCPSIERAKAQTADVSETPISPPRECTGRFVAGPAVGIPLGLGAAAIGGVLIYAGTNPLGDAFSQGSNNNARGAIAGGAILVGAGLAAFLYSAVKLHKNLEVRRRLCGDDGYQPLAVTSGARARRVAFTETGFRF